MRTGRPLLQDARRPGCLYGWSVTRLLALALTAVLAVAPASAYAEEVDTTPPRVALDPCPEQPLGEACTRREYAVVVQDRVAEEEGLAVAGVREGDTVLSEHVYDDGSGFVPYGSWVHPGSDVITEVDHVTEARLGPGLHHLTFYARDLAGNEAVLTRTVVGPELPGRVRRVRWEQDRRGGEDVLHIRWSPAAARGSAVHCYVVRTTGVRREKQCGGPPSGPWRAATLQGLQPGTHVVRILARNGVGVGPARRVTVQVR